MAASSPDPYLSDFASRGLEANGVLSRRVMQRQYRRIYVSVGKVIATASAAGALGYMVTRKSHRDVPRKKKVPARTSKRPLSQKVAD